MNRSGKPLSVVALTQPTQDINYYVKLGHVNREKLKEFSGKTETQSRAWTHPPHRMKMLAWTWLSYRMSSDVLLIEL